MSPLSNKQINHPYGLVHRWKDVGGGHKKLMFYWTEFTEGHIMAMDNDTKEVCTERYRNRFTPSVVYARLLLADLKEISLWDWY